MKDGRKRRDETPRAQLLTLGSEVGIGEKVCLLNVIIPLELEREKIENI